MPDQVAIILLITMLAIIAIGFFAVRNSGYRFGSDTIVRCREGHLFTTVWIPGASLKAIRLGPVRFQYCPVGDHVTFIVPVRDQDLTEAQRQLAHLYHDRRVP
jgi:hypothetical protein